MDAYTAFGENRPDQNFGLWSALGLYLNELELMNTAIVHWPVQCLLQSVYTNSNCIIVLYSHGSALFKVYKCLELMFLANRAFILPFTRYPLV